jgi:hypothetical protein
MACYCSEMSRWPRCNSSDSCHASCRYSTTSIMPRRCFENSLYEKHSGGARATQLRQTHNGDVGQELSEALPVKQSRFHEAFIAFAPASRTTAVASQGCNPAVKTTAVLAVTMRILAGASYLDVGWPYGLADSTMCNLAAFTCTRVQPGHKHELLRCASFFRNPGALTSDFPQNSETETRMETPRMPLIGWLR